MPRRSGDNALVPERRAWDGSVVITRRQLALLHGLLDRPDGMADCLGDWILSAVPYLSNSSRGALFGVLISLYKVPTAWVRRIKVGRCLRVVLLPRGRDILELRVQTRIHGHGVYRGLRHLRDATVRKAP